MLSHNFIEQERPKKSVNNYYELLSQGLVTRGKVRIILVPESLGYYMESFRQWFYHKQKVISKTFYNDDPLEAIEICGPSRSQRHEEMLFGNQRCSLKYICEEINSCFDDINQTITQILKYHIKYMDEELRNSKWDNIDSIIQEIKLKMTSCGEKRRKLRMSDEYLERDKYVDPSGKWKDDICEIITVQKALREKLNSLNKKLHASIRTRQSYTHCPCCNRLL